MADNGDKATKPVTLVSFGASRCVCSFKATQLTLAPADVDGTLMESIGQKSNQLHRQSFAHAFKTVFDADTHIDVVQHHGSTDPLICIKVLVHYGIPKDEVRHEQPLAPCIAVQPTEK
jgi:hypothetical protein